jgi:hypothetical protein
MWRPCTAYIKQHYNSAARVHLQGFMIMNTHTSGNMETIKSNDFLEGGGPSLSLSEALSPLW